MNNYDYEFSLLTEKTALPSLQIFLRKCQAMSLVWWQQA